MTKGDISDIWKMIQRMEGTFEPIGLWMLTLNDVYFNIFKFLLHIDEHFYPGRWTAFIQAN